MKIVRSLFPAMLLVTALAACQPSPKVVIDGDPVLGRIQVKDDRVGVKAQDGSFAWVRTDGSLEIDGKPMALTPAQRALTLRYHAEAVALQADAIAIGKAGVGMAGKTVGNVVQGLLGGDPETIGPKVEKDAAMIEATAMQLCRRVGTLQEAQDALVAAVPTFAPYSTIKDHQKDACKPRDDSDDAGSVSSAELIAAADRGDVEEVRRLVQQGGDVNGRVRGDGTALIRAARRGHLEVVDELLGLGAEVDLPSRRDGNPLIAASMTGERAVVARLLEAGADVDAVVSGDETALINAARNGHLAVVKLLVEGGADVNRGVRADLGQWRSPLNQAKDPAIREYLVGAGASGEA